MPRILISAVLGGVQRSVAKYNVQRALPLYIFFDMLSVVLPAVIIDGVEISALPTNFAIRLEGSDGPLLRDGLLLPTAQNDVVYRLFINGQNGFIPAVVARVNGSLYKGRRNSDTYLSVTRRRESARDRAMNRDLCCVASGLAIQNTIYERNDSLYMHLQENTGNNQARSADAGQEFIHGAHIFPIAQLNAWDSANHRRTVANDNAIFYTNNHIKLNQTTPVSLEPSKINSVANIIPLESSYHTAFDLHRFAIHPGSLTIVPFGFDFFSLPNLRLIARTRILLGPYQPFMVSMVLLRQHFEQACLYHMRLDEHNVMALV